MPAAIVLFLYGVRNTKILQVLKVKKVFSHFFDVYYV